MSSLCALSGNMWFPALPLQFSWTLFAWRNCYSNWSRIGWGFFSFLQFLDVLRPKPVAWSDCSSVCDWVSVLTWTLLHPNPLQVYSYSYICFLLPFLGHFDLKDKLLLQLMSSLVWSHAVLWMCSPGPTSFVEFFPGHILSDHRLPEASVRPLIA